MTLIQEINFKYQINKQSGKVWLNNPKYLTSKLF